MKISLLSFFMCLFLGCSFTNTDNFVDVKGSKIHYRVKGKGRPTVIFESGMGNSMEVWNAIPDSMSKVATVFYYDRAGLGESDISAVNRSIPNMVEELKIVLKKAGLKPPYLYVSHSMGTYLARYYATHFPEEVSGLLLIDPSPDKMYDAYSEKEYNEFKDFGDDSFANATEGERLEWESYLENRRFVQDNSISKSIPMIILSATQWDFYEYHHEILNQNKHSKHLKIEGSHDLHIEKPELITELIHELLKISKDP